MDARVNKNFEFSEDVSDIDKIIKNVKISVQKNPETDYYG
jgi:hypothetical protein